MERGKLCNQLMRLGTHLASIFDREMAGHGLTQAQFRNLIELSCEAQSPGLLAERLMLDKATVSLMVRRMEDAGWVQRLPGPNRRTHLLALTDQGKQATESALDSAMLLADRVTEALEQAEVETLRRILDKLENRLRSPQ